MGIREQGLGDSQTQVARRLRMRCSNAFPLIPYLPLPQFFM